ncbi:MAG: hypothetical protein AAF509_14650 [Pseudomonadota bacterium]
MQRVVQWAAPFYQSSGQTDVDVTIRGGIQDGLATSISASTLRIGSSTQDDIVLLDPLAADEHANVRFWRSAFGQVAEISALERPIRVNGTEFEAGSIATDITLPFTVAIGATSLNITRTELVVSEKNSASFFNLGWFQRYDPVLLFAIFGFATAFALAILYGGITSFSKFHTVTFNSQTPPTPAHFAAPDRDWLSEANAQIATFELNETLRIEPAAGGLLKISGTVTDEKLERLRNLQAWFDGQPGIPTTIWKVLRQPRLNGIPSITMIRLSEPAAVFTSNGVEIREGEEMIEDWMLKSIEPENFTLQRGEERVTIDYRTGNIL